MKIKTKMAFSGVPTGTTGDAVKEKDGKSWKITWDLPNRAKPLVDWFDCAEYDEFMEEI